MKELLTFLLEDDDLFRRARLPSLYSDFRQQQATNPDGFRANVNAWITRLSEAARLGMIPGCSDSTMLLRTGPQLLEALETKEWGRPSALGAAVDEALYQGSIVPLSSFLSSKSAVVNSKTGFQPWSLLYWTKWALGLAGSGTGNLARSNYVFIANVEDVAQRTAAIFDHHNNRVDRIIPICQFEAEISRLLGLQNGISKKDLTILLTYLAREKGQIAFDDRLVKVKGNDAEMPIIDPRDRDIASLKSLTTELEAQCAAVSSKIKVLTRNTGEALSHGNRIQARHYLRSRKMQQGVLEKRTATLSQLEDILTSISEAVTQIEVMNVIRSGTLVLHDLNSEVGGLERVHVTLEDLSEEISKTQAVESALRDELQFESSINDSEVDAELEALELESKKQTKERTADEVAEKIDALPVISGDASKERVPADQLLTE